MVAHPRPPHTGRGSRRSAALAACTLATAVLLVATSPGVAAPVTQATVSIAAEQVAVVSADHRPAVVAASEDLRSAQAALVTTEDRRARDQSLLAQAVTLTGQATAGLAADTARLGRDTAARLAATAAIAGDDARLQAIGVQLYVSPDAVPVDGPDALATAQEDEFATEVIDIGAHEVITDLHLRRSEQRRDAAAVLVDDRDLSTDRATLARVTALRADRASLLDQDGEAIAVAGAALTAAQATLTARTAALTAAVAAVANPPGTPDDGSPSIEGTSALDAAQIVGWYDYEGWGDLTSAPIQALVNWYLAEGAAEGVRGDVAFAQAMVETAGFSSNDAVALNNYAGIGHCDTCASGLPFPSPELGVRGQIQLLHSFADASLTAGELARPLAVASLAPQTQPDRGCCTTWQSLTGKWATDPSYGHTVMAVYASMLGYALDPPTG